MFPLIRSTGSKKQSRLAAHTLFFCQLTARISIPSNNSSRDSNRSYAKRRRALLSSFGEQSPLFSKRFPKTNAKLISQTRATPNLIEKCSRSTCGRHREIDSRRRRSGGIRRRLGGQDAYPAGRRPPGVRLCGGRHFGRIPCERGAAAAAEFASVAH